MTRVKKPSPMQISSEELLDDIERALFKANAAKRPDVEELLWMAFIEASETREQDAGE